VASAGPRAVREVNRGLSTPVHDGPEPAILPRVEQPSDGYTPCAVRALLDALAALDATWVKRHRAINTLGLFAVIAAKRGRRDQSGRDRSTSACSVAGMFRQQT
jgi:hypothetical protein